MILRVFIGVAVVTSLCGLARSQERINCALIIDESTGIGLSDLVSVLEVTLSQDPRVRLVERSKIAEVLEEQQIQMLLGPAAGPDRRALGGLLGADLLILLRNAQSDQAASVDVVVAETRQGLRLLARRLAASGDPDAGASKIQEWVHRAIRTCGQPVLRVFAVPPFRTRDLLHEYDYLQWALARATEQILLQYPGLIVVEIEEAAAITRELSLTGPDVDIKRRLPHYILGVYRNDGGRKNRTVSVTLHLKYGDNALRTASEEGLSPGIVGPTVRRYVEEFAGQVLGRDEPLPSGGQEAEFLARRADEFMEIASWREALAILEASLLLKRDQPEVHRKAVYVLTQLANLNSSDEWVCLNFYRAGLEHLEYYLRAAKINTRNTMNFMSGYWACAKSVEESPRLTAPFQRIVSEINKEKRAMILRVMAERARQGQLDEEAAVLLTWYPFYGYAKIDETREENYADRLAAIQIVKDLSNARRLVLQLLPYESSVDLTDQAYVELLDKVAAIPNPEVQAAVKNRRQYHENQAIIAKRPPLPRPRPSLGSDEEPGKEPDVVFEPLKLFSYSPEGIKTTLNGLGGLLRCAEGIDFLWTSQAFHLLEHDGARCIHCFEESSLAIMEPCYDGKYVWVPVKWKDGSCLMVVNPATRRVAKVADEEGLPLFETRAVCAAVEPGKVCVAGGLRARGWCAIVSMAGDHVEKVDVFHEARKNAIPDSGGIGVAGDTHLAFIPLFMRVMWGSKEGSRPQFVIARSCRLETRTYPLLVDPVRRSVFLLPVAVGIGFPYDYVTSHEGALYWVGDSGREGSYTLWCLRPDAPDKRGVASALPCEGIVVFVDDIIHIAGPKWLSAKDLRDGFFEMNAEFPPGSWYDRSFWHTNHYGLVMTSRGQAYQVKLRVLPGSSDFSRRRMRSVYRSR
jgi:hypothetical protein